MGYMVILAIKTLFRVATDLGMTSPKTRIRNVMIPVASPTAWFGNILMVTDVARDAAPIFTRLFPIRMEERSRWGSSFICLISKKDLVLFLARCRAFVLLMENKAVSADEKKPDNNSKITNNTTWFIIVYIDPGKKLGDRWFSPSKEEVLQLSVLYYLSRVSLAKEVMSCDIK